jgi:hypothetical protein
MATMGRYCKAYLVNRFREYPRWAENLSNLRGDRRMVDGREVEEITLADDDHLYLQDNYVVTDGIFTDENIIFDGITPEWIEFCKTTLNFEIPEYLSEHVS